MVSVVLGGARSGKSRLAQCLGSEYERAIYIATARAEDAEMAARMARHRRERGETCAALQKLAAQRTRRAEAAREFLIDRVARPARACAGIEEPLHIADAVERHGANCDFVLADCLTLWLSNYCREHRRCGEAAIEEGAMREVGCGLVPESAVGCMFGDLQGVAGIPIAIKQPGGAR